MTPLFLERTLFLHTLRMVDTVMPLVKNFPVLPALGMTDTEWALVKDVRVLRGDDVLAIVQGTPRPLGRRVEVVVGSGGLAGHAAPGLGRGLLCALQEPQGAHVVSVFRCEDGRFLYYDPTPRQVYLAFDVFVRRNDIDAATVTVMRAGFQRPGFRTCAYHALTFLDYVTRLGLQDSRLTLASFRRHMGRATDLNAISTVRGLLQEFPNSVSLSTSLTPGANPVFVPPTPSSPPHTACPAPPPPPTRTPPKISFPSTLSTEVRPAPPPPLPRTTLKLSSPSPARPVDPPPAP